LDTGASAYRLTAVAIRLPVAATHWQNETWAEQRLGLARTADIPTAAGVPCVIATVLIAGTGDIAGAAALTQIAAVRLFGDSQISQLRGVAFRCIAGNQEEQKKREQTLSFHGRPPSPRNSYPSDPRTRIDFSYFKHQFH
jgi:hypothetical protein